jgi:hypothetical protein
MVNADGIEATSNTVDPGYIVALSGKDSGVGHGCPISEHLMLTADHMTAERTSGGVQRSPLRWSDSYGGMGVVRPVADDPASDLALMRSEEPFSKWFPIASTAPKVGATVYIVGYTFDHDKFKQPRLVTTKVVSESAGRIYYEKHGSPGSSGSCTLNTGLEIVSINNTMEGGPDDSGYSVGGSVAVYGSWCKSLLGAVP